MRVYVKSFFSYCGDTRLTQYYNASGSRPINHCVMIIARRDKPLIDRMQPCVSGTQYMVVLTNFLALPATNNSSRFLAFAPASNEFVKTDFLLVHE